MKAEGEIQWQERSSHDGERRRHLPCHMPWSLSLWAAPGQAHHCATGCVESHGRLGAGGARLCSQHVNKSIFKWEAVGEGKATEGRAPLPLAGFSERA